jgi:hypothetical protein
MKRSNESNIDESGANTESLNESRIELYQQFAFGYSEYCLYLLAQNSTPRHSLRSIRNIYMFVVMHPSFGTAKS